jgi:hypothetical protein
MQDAGCGMRDAGCGIYLQGAGVMGKQLRKKARVCGGVSNIYMMIMCQEGFVGSE